MALYTLSMKISYRPHDRSDIEARVAWLNDWEIRRWFDGYREKGTTLAKQRAWFKLYAKDRTRDFHTILEDGAAVGVVGLTDIDRKNKQAELFIMIGAGHRGQGLGQQAVRHIIRHAFGKRQLHRIGLHVSAQNKAAIGCYLKAGFKHEGVLKDDRLVASVYDDTVLMGIIAPS